MKQGVADALRAAEALFAAGAQHDWAAIVLLQDHAGGLGRGIAHDVQRGRRREAREAIAAALLKVPA